MSFVSVAAVVGTGLGIYNTVKGDKAAGNQAVATADPFASQRAGYQGPTMDLFRRLLGFSGEDYQNDPMYKSLVASGIDTVNMGSAAQGRLRSGNRDVALQTVGMRAADQTINQRWSQLFNLLQQGSMLSGASINPGTAATLQYDANGKAINAQNAGINALFQGLPGFLNNFGGGSAPTVPGTSTTPSYSSWGP